MYGSVSDEDVREVVDVLVGVFGVREGGSTRHLVPLMRDSGIEVCVAAMALSFGLPVRTLISFVPESRFSTQALVKSEARATSDTTAQVIIPDHLPLYGSSSLIGFPISILVSESVRQNPQALIMAIAHELSHVLLHALRHPQKDSELYTDLVPLVFGFGEIVRRSRKEVSSSSDGSNVAVTYGYLSDAQFGAATKHVERILRERRMLGADLHRGVSAFSRRTDHALGLLSQLEELLHKLAGRRPSRMRANDARRVVELHGPGVGAERGRLLGDCQARAREIVAFLQNVEHHSSHLTVKLEQYLQSIDVMSDALEAAIRGIERDMAMLRRYVGLWRWLH